MTTTMGQAESVDLKLNKNLKKGDKEDQVKLIQEWLSLHGLGLSLDGDFGSATEGAVKHFQKDNGLGQTGIVDQATFDLLVKPMTEALKAIKPDGHTVASLTLAYAKQHAAQHPREIGGQNRGPWVRLYMDGKEGVAWPWCAGFVSFCLKAACDTSSKKLPITPSYSCTFLAVSAEKNGRFLNEPNAAERKKVAPGSIFLIEKTENQWQHTGIVSSVEGDYFHTIEGNTNDDGSREGYEVCKRIRRFSNRIDFILVG